MTGYKPSGAGRRPALLELVSAAGPRAVLSDADVDPEAGS